ncbi:glycosyltransferase family 17 protein [Zasmidium cellare ATCC 36951]|uniref:Glycosyltransferase family 17 protein n=1 Tax=Zasmidium cellare ATCC 36951 TaxID=1080233 RepID=A0A6A6C7Y3_ZASCE|nr:glycosyltransferase family 17 protein [Zasmidium cellare ATCC 36951]KAF2163155.1 glycosyltransferase family 17 protein [Zasmidium cellare ATCC 36951]
MLLSTSSRVRSRRRLAWLAVIATGVVLALWLVQHDGSREHVLDHNVVRRYAASGSDDFAARKALCDAHDFLLSPSPEKKLYDLILLSTELDWLEIRLNTLGPYVSYFVILESPTTFTGQPKPTLLDDPVHWNRFRNFHQQIIHRIVEDPVNSTRAWDHEDFFRNALLTSTFPTLEGTKAEPKKGDVLLVSDVDELIRPETAVLLNTCEIPRRLTLMSQFFYYSFQWRHIGPPWPHPQATTYMGSMEETLRPNDLRMDILPPSSIFSLPFSSLRRWYDRATLQDAGWHCSSCFATVAEFQTKMSSFSHKSLNTEENRDAGTIVERVRKGEDLFGREGETYEFLERERMDLPGFVEDEWRDKGRFGWLVERTGRDGGFVD